MQITLEMPELEEFIDQQVKAGSYLSPADVVSSALALLRGQTQTSEAEIDELRAAVMVGLDEANRGLSEPWDADEIAAEVERRIGDERKTG